jgi:small-conductance mechanosensitive channel
MGIDVALKENNIVIPFPQQDLHIRTTVENLLDSDDQDLSNRTTLESPPDTKEPKN